MTAQASSKLLPAILVLTACSGSTSNPVETLDNTGDEATMQDEGLPPSTQLTDDPSIEPDTMPTVLEAQVTGRAIVAEGWQVPDAGRPQPIWEIALEVTWPAVEGADSYQVYSMDVLVEDFGPDQGIYTHAFTVQGPRSTALPIDTAAEVVQEFVPELGVSVNGGEQALVEWELISP